MSSWSEATRRLDETLRCPKCGATNRPHATYVERVSVNHYHCIVCAHAGPREVFVPKEAA